MEEWLIGWLKSECDKVQTWRNQESTSFCQDSIVWSCLVCSKQNDSKSFISFVFSLVIDSEHGREEEWRGWDGECGMLPNSKVW